MKKIRTFKTGATRDTAANKPDYRGYLSPLVLHRFGQYMLKHQVQSDGTLRASDNWKRGMPQEEYLSSGLRHILDVWLHLEHHPSLAREDVEEALCAALFNIQGLLHETIKARMK